MFRRKIDGVIEAVRYTPEGPIEWVRMYERRDMAYSDVLILKRDELIERLDAGQLFYTGKRKKYQGNAFETDRKVITKEKNGGKIVLTEGSDEDHDLLEDIPLV
ncbi:MAG: hypothetical protein R6U57_02060 [Anaerolineales bacterium]